MPRGDRTGPLGLGPRSGRGLGFCSGYNLPGFQQKFRGIGRCFRGRGFGASSFFPRFWPEAKTYSPPYEEEKEYLKKELNFLEKQILNLKEKLKKLEAID